LRQARESEVLARGSRQPRHPPRARGRRVRRDFAAGTRGVASGR